MEVVKEMLMEIFECSVDAARWKFMPSCRWCRHELKEKTNMRSTDVKLVI